MGPEPSWREAQFITVILRVVYTENVAVSTYFRERNEVYATYNCFRAGRGIHFLRSIELQTVINPVADRPGNTDQIPTQDRGAWVGKTRNFANAIRKAIGTCVSFANYLEQVGHDQCQRPLVLFVI